MVASEEGHTEIVAMLLQTKGIDVNEGVSDISSIVAHCFLHYHLLLTSNWLCDMIGLSLSTYSHLLELLYITCNCLCGLFVHSFPICSHLLRQLRIMVILKLSTCYCMSKELM